MSQRLTVTAAARTDITRLLRASSQEFGAAARDRYGALIVTALSDLRADGRCMGSADREEIGAGVRTYHLRHCRKRAAKGGRPVLSPRHLLAYRIEAGGEVVILRVLHDAMELASRLPSPER